MAFWDKFTTWLGFEWVRARDEKSTPNVDESKKKVYKSRTKKK
jgi:hypothetical protein